jgi:hypothetical protein
LPGKILLLKNLADTVFRSGGFFRYNEELSSPLKPTFPGGFTENLQKGNKQ